MEMKSQEMKELELKRIEEWLKKLIPDSWDKYDFKAKYDSTLSYAENKSAIRDDIKVLLKDSDLNLKEQVEKIKCEQERINQERIRDAEKEVEDYNKNAKFEINQDIDKFYRPVHRAVDKLCQGYSHLVFIKGRGGIGKSENIRRRLIHNHSEFVEVCGEVTEAYLYRLIYENNGKIIWFKDVVKLLSHIGSINLLKSATETSEIKILTKSNYSKDQGDLPDKFACKCKFVFDYNNLFGASLRDDFEALTSRGDFIELPMSDDDIKQIMRCIAKEDWQKEVTEHLVTNFQPGLVRINLRTQWKAFRTYEYANANGLNWREEISGEIKADGKTRVMLYSLIGTRAVRTTELKKALLRHEICNTLRTCDHRINDWLFLEELYKVSEEERNFYICINPIKREQNVLNVQ